MPRAGHWKPFIIPQNFLISLPSHSSALLSLPVELLIKVFYHADWLDQLSLAFSCKYPIQISAFVSIETPTPILHKTECSCRKLEELLRRVKPLNVRGRPKKTWAVCVDCQRYRPTRKSYWKKKSKAWKAEDWDYSVELWNEHVNLQCPECEGKEVRNRRLFESRFRERGHVTKCL